MLRDGFFEYEITNEGIDVTLVSVTDTRTGVVVRTPLASNGIPYASIQAFAGARFSRSQDSVYEIMKEIHEAESSADQKLATIFRAYGHASVADMSIMMAYMENVPKYFDAKFFYETSLGGGQGRSSRYQDYSTSKLKPLNTIIAGWEPIDSDGHLNAEWSKLQQLSIDFYSSWKERLHEAFIQEYGINREDRKELSALTARVFDCARYFLIAGGYMETSLAWTTSAREWGRLIALFKSESDSNMVCLGEQLEALFSPSSDIAEQLGYTPEAAELIRYTDADTTTQEVFDTLQRELTALGWEYTPYEFDAAHYRVILWEHELGNVDPALKSILQAMWTCYPDMDWRAAYSWLEQLHDEHKIRLTKLCTESFTHHKQMGNQFRTNELSYYIEGSLAEIIDLNRHRAWGRFWPAFSTQSPESIMNYGFVIPAYFEEGQKLAGLREEFEQDMTTLYESIQAFLDMLASSNEHVPQTFVYQLLPLGHKMPIMMHASLKELSYMSQLRTRPGGHINYRLIAWELVQKAKDWSPWLAGMDIGARPDPSSRTELLDRS